MPKRFYANTIAALKTFKPKKGPKKHWYFKKPNELTTKEQQEKAAFTRVFLDEWLQYDLHLEKKV